MDAFLANLTHFIRVLRNLGLPLSAADVATCAHALERVGIRNRADVKSAARSVLVHRREHRAVFDRAFDAFWRANAASTAPAPPGGPDTPRLEPADVAAVGIGGPDDVAAATLDGAGLAQQTWSDRERLRHRDFGDLTEAEIAGVRALMCNMRVTPRPRRTRRLRPDRRGARPDLRGTVRRSLRHGGEPMRILRRSRREEPRRIVILCDVSGSMSSYSRLLLQFVYAVVQQASRVDVFAFATRLTRLTRQLGERRIDGALQAASHALVDWGGGTRIGESVRRFNREWGRRVLGRGAIVLLISDGWDRGDAMLLGDEMARLRRSCHRLLWLNPLIAQPGFAPLTAGLRAALPHVDEFLPAHNLASLDQLAALLRSARELAPARSRRDARPPLAGARRSGTESTSPKPTWTAAKIGRHEE